MPKSNKRHMILWVFIGAVLLGGLLAVAITFLALCRRRVKRFHEMILPWHRKPGHSAPSKLLASGHLDAINFGPRRFSYAELRVATNDFGEEKLLGRGGFGSVYKGVILESTNQKEKLMVAIKRMAKNSKQGEREFLAEVLSIGRLRHRNLASLLGWCHERDELLLVYEFMAKGSLDLHLYHKLGYPALPWPSRFRILQGIASALDYLHFGWEKCILHRDIKPSNVMLDCQMNARLGDFGLARIAGHTIVSEGRNTSSRVWNTGSTVGGTLGYMAPEVFLYGQLTKKADVYSFGMVALEVVCGRRPPGFHSEDDEDNLVEWVWREYKKGQLLEVMDPCLRDDFPGMNCSKVQQQVTTVLHLGMLCTLLDPSLRPPTNQLLQALNDDWSISLPASRLDSGALAISRKNYAVYFGARVFSYAELRTATDNFSDARLIGQGCYGYVYKGILTESNESNQDDSVTVAIKRISPNSRGEESHVELLNLIGRSRHRNLVSLLGWSYEQNELLLVYEIMENGCLETHLHPTDGNAATHIPWTSRFKILQGVAAALDYLHSGCQENCVLHKDIKPNTVMLDKHMTAKLADFGLKQLAGQASSIREVDHNTSYLAPELVFSGSQEAASVKSDVYSFGMLALELVCVRPPHGEDLVKWVWSMHKRGQLWDAVDLRNLGSAFFKKLDRDEEALKKQVDFDFDEVEQQQQITRVLQLGVSCTLPEPTLRPHSKRLLQALYGDWNVSLPSSTSFEDYDSSTSTDPLLRYTRQGKVRKGK